MEYTKPDVPCTQLWHWQEVLVWQFGLALGGNSEGATNPFLIYATFLSLSFSICEMGTREGQQHHSLGMKLALQMSL